MSEPSSDREIFGAKWAARICLALIIGFAAITGVAYYDQNRTASLETTEANTAVGDKALFPLPAGGSVKITFHGQVLSPTSLKKYDERDSRMIRKGLDDSKAYSVYAPTERVKSLKGEASNPGEAFYFLKVAPGEYLKLRASGN